MGGAPKGGAPKGGAPKGGAPEGWGPKISRFFLPRRVGGRRSGFGAFKKSLWVSSRGRVGGPVLSAGGP